MPGVTPLVYELYGRILELKILTMHLFFTEKKKPASWSSGNAFVCGAVGLRFKSRASQIGHSVANGSSPLRHFFEGS